MEYIRGRLIRRAPRYLLNPRLYAHHTVGAQACFYRSINYRLYIHAYDRDDKGPELIIDAMVMASVAQKRIGDLGRGNDVRYWAVYSVLGCICHERWNYSKLPSCQQEKLSNIDSLKDSSHVIVSLHRCSAPISYQFNAINIGYFMISCLGFMSCALNCVTMVVWDGKWASYNV